MRWNIFLFLISSAAVIIFFTRFLHEPWHPLRVAGALVIALATTLIFTARLQLGPSFSALPRATRLVTTGLYRRLRNPIYLFGCVLFLGLALFLPAWWPLALLLLVVPVQAARAHREAAVLEAAFGEEYRRYRARTWL